MTEEILRDGKVICFIVIHSHILLAVSAPVANKVAFLPCQKEVGFDR